MTKERELLERASDFISKYCKTHHLSDFAWEKMKNEISFDRQYLIEDIETYLSTPVEKEKISSAEDVIQAANECAKESQRNNAPVTDEDALNLVKNS